MMPEAIKNLPVWAVLPQLKAALAGQKRAVLQAPPGAGKTTAVPLALLDQAWLENKKILILEPRRLAARSCARYMAGLLKESPGGTVGYRIRMERRVGPSTRIEVITEGILTRMIQSDPSLETVGLVIFDEFHERHIHSDLGLALCLESAEVLREDLRLLVMSATMDTGALARLMDPAPVISSRGRTWPVETFYLPPDHRGRPGGSREGASRFSPVPEGCARAVEKALAGHEGDILVFLPGRAEIQRVASLLEGRMPAHVRVMPLFGNLSQADQHRAIAPSRQGYRKIVLATAIAETSLTIEGVSVVVDSGLMRQPRFLPGIGMSRLETLPVSRASADQRRGRAGRTGPGVCYRIWSGHVNKGLVPFTRPEILCEDITGVALELALWGVSDPAGLKWLDPPPEKAFGEARALLARLGALDGQGRITAHGKALAGTGVHPRLAHMILAGKKAGNGPLACLLAALLGERDFLAFDRETRDPDIRLRLEVLEVVRKKQPAGGGCRVNHPLARSILAAAAKLQKDLKVPAGPMDPDRAGITLALGFPERVGRRRGHLSYLLASGKGAYFREPNTVSIREYLVAAHVDGAAKNACIFLAAPLPEQELTEMLADRMETRDLVIWDGEGRRVKAVRQTVYGKLLIREESHPEPDPEAVQQAVLDGVRHMGIESLPWTRKLSRLRQQTRFLREHAGIEDLPDLSDAGLTAGLSDWLGPFLGNVRTAGDLKKLDLNAALSLLLPWDRQQTVQRQAPTHMVVPSGSRIPLRYEDGGTLLPSPVLAVRLQEMFGLARTPRIAENRIPVTLHLLSPANRPVQVTQDLENFWNHTYREVKKDLMGRYPKHFWPDDPMAAAPTSRAKPRKRSAR